MPGRSTAKRPTPPRWLVRTVTQAHVALYKLTSGRLGARLGGRPALLLRTMGRRSGKAHTVALSYLTDGDSMVVTASNSGADVDPAWYHNMEAAPEVIVRRRGEVFWARHETLQGQEREDLWDELVAADPSYAGYADKTSRQIPLVRLTYSRAYTG